MEKILNLQKMDVEKMHTVKVENSIVMSYTVNHEYWLIF